MKKIALLLVVYFAFFASLAFGFAVGEEGLPGGFTSVASLVAGVGVTGLTISIL